ncbi:long-chain acyl-CoA synthetase [Rarobacter incanus]|uniref:Long-chain acyl-CoA synthetase n=2 Tax=Rarobacter incanus TaxID=153494 RepID=A0A542SM24_9MICO|nr:long-chain acyl-CoA synthetase [Rarobacter incanus]
MAFDESVFVTPEGTYRDAPTVPRDIEVPNESVLAAFERAIRANPQRTALYFMGAKTTYYDLGVQVLRAANALRSLGVTAGDRVAIALPNCPAHVVAFLATLRLGAVVVEHNPLYSAAELERQLNSSGSSVVIAWQPTAVRVSEVIKRTQAHTLISVDVSKDLPFLKRIALHLPVKKARETKAQLTQTPPTSAIDWHKLVGRTRPILQSHPYPQPADTALLQYTGGTTGEPRGAVITHRNLVANAIQGQAWTGLDASDPNPAVMYGVLPLFHAYGMTLTFIFGLRVGGTIVLFPKFSADDVVATQRRIPGTFMAAVPPMLDRIVAAERKHKADFSSMTYVLSGAMALPKSTAQAWEHLTGGYVIEGYGMTECSPVALGNPIGPKRRPGWLGLPFPSTHIRLADQDDPTRDAEPGTRGELLIRGPQVFGGYWGELDDEQPWVWRGEEKWLRTGDVVEVDEFGFVKLVDRVKEMIITGGFKVYPSQVEAVLTQMPGVLEAAVVGMPGGDLGERVVAALVLPDADAPQLPDIDLPSVSVPHVDLPHLKVPHLEMPKMELPKVDLSKVELPKVDLSKVDLPHVDLDAVRAWCSEHLARYAIPKEIVIVKELPKSQIGKVLRRVVRDDLAKKRDDGDKQDNS